MEKTARIAPAAQDWNAIFAAKARELYPSDDPSHDSLHIARVVSAALKLAQEEGADINVVLPAAYFHDFVNVPKDDPRRKQASQLSAAAAVEYLASIGYDPQYFGAIAHAIAAHSFSAGIAPETLEAKVVQDADRLDALGAIGLARVFTICGLLKRPYYCMDDMLAETRTPDDTRYAVDHFFIKLFRLPAMMQTASARREGERRVQYMKDYLQQLKAEVTA